MLRFIAGAVLGLVLGIAVTAKAEVSVTGDIGWLFGWTVKVDRETVCKDPQVWVPAKEISCRGM